MNVLYTRNLHVQACLFNDLIVVPLSTLRPASTHVELPADEGGLTEASMAKYEQMDFGEGETCELYMQCGTRSYAATVLKTIIETVVDVYGDMLWYVQVVMSKFNKSLNTTVR